VDTEDVTGDHGREDAIEVRDKLRLNTPLIEVVISPYAPAADGDRLGGVAFTVDVRSSESTFVELFQRCFIGAEAEAVWVLELYTFVPRGEESGVRLRLYLCAGRSGVVGVGVAPDRNPPNIDVRLRRALFCELLGGGSDDGVRERLFLLIDNGVTVLAVVPVILRANFLKGEIEREIVLPVLLEPLCGVLR
jgi:hypothetical protein